MATSGISGDIEQTKRRQALTGIGVIPPGIAPTPEQIKAISDKAVWERSRLRQDAFKQSVAGGIGGIGNAMSQVARTVTTTADAGLAALGNIRFDSNLPDYRSPEQKALSAEKAQQFSPLQQAGGVEAYDITQRAVQAAQQPFSSGIAKDMLVLKGQQPGLSTAPDASSSKPISSAVSSGAKAVSGGGAGGPAEQGNGWSQTGISGIAGRMGANGAPEFTNESTAVQGAGPQRAIGRVGDGIGGFSQGSSGDAALASERFEKANAERAAAIANQGGLRVAGIRGEAPTSAEVLNARLGLRIREADRADRELQQRSIDAGLDRALRERELAGTEQRNWQELEAGEMSLAQQRQVADLYARYEQALPEERAALAEQIRTLTGREAPNRFTVVPGGQEIDQESGRAFSQPSRVFNNQTGQFVNDGGQQLGSPRMTIPQVGEQRGGYRFKGGNPADQNSWEKV